MSIKDQLQKLKEDELRKMIIIPLLKVLGFGCVEDWCGPNEDGKDIIYVRQDPLISAFIVGAVLIKNKKDIKKSGGNDIREIESEAKEAIMKPLSSPLDPYQQVNIRELYVATAFDIKREARDYIHEVLRSSQLIIRFFTGEDLQKKIEEIVGESNYVFDVNSFASFCINKKENIGAKEVFKEAPYITKVKEGKSIEPKLSEINQIIKSKKYLENKNTVLGFLKDSKLRYYFLDKLPKKFDDLQEVSFILEELVGDKKPFELFHLLENSVRAKNNDYILKFIAQHYENFVESLGQRIDRMFQEQALEIVKKIVGADESQIDNVLKFLTKILKKRKYNSRKVFDRGDDIEQERERVAEILFEITKKKGVSDEMVSLIANSFDLISDCMRLSYSTPNPIFVILNSYILQSKDFEIAFQKIAKVILSQHTHSKSYQDKSGVNKFAGYEWWGGGISQGGSHFSISDSHFVEQVLRPALDEYYLRNSGKAFDFVKSFCIWRNKDKAITLAKNHPDFLLRASVGILLREYKKGNKETGNILVEFLKITKGIPSKADLIFQEVLKGDYSLSTEQKYSLIRKQLDIKMYEGLPANVFVLRVIIDLVKENYPPAVDLFFGLAKNDKLYKRIWHAESVIIEMIGAMLESDTIKGLSGFKSYIETDFFKNGLGTFDAYPVSDLLNNILNNSDLYKDGIRILNDLSGQPEPLTTNQQILVCNCLINSKGKSDSEDAEVLMKIYNDFLWPLLNEKLEKNLKRSYKEQDYGLIYKRFPFNNAREQFVQFAERLARKKKIDEALNIVEIFINDPDPFTPLATDPRDPKGEYDEDKKIREGKEMSIISTVRGWCGWALMQCSVVESGPYIKKMIGLAKKLIEDNNWYVASYGANALSGLAGNRLTVLPENKDILFFGETTAEALENAKQVEKIAFEYLEKVKKAEPKVQDAIHQSLLHLFNPLRALNQNDAKKFIDALASMSDKTIAEAAPLFIYFAEFREGHFKDWKWQMEGLYDDLGIFDSEPFKKVIEEILKRGVGAINSSFAWHSWKLKSEVSQDEAFPIACKYLNIIADCFDSLAFSHIFRFIEENFQEKPEECYNLLKKVLDTEKKWVEQQVQEKGSDIMNWWPHYNIGDILVKITDCLGPDKCLDAIEFLLAYPVKLGGRNISGLSEVLQAMSPEVSENKRVEKIFDKLIEIDPRYYDTKELWKKKFEIKRLK